jgi:copper chaperone CopZ
MNIVSKISAATLLLFSSSSCNAQIKNAKTEIVKIYGNCEMCEKTIETAGNVKKVANVEWNKDSKMATITYDSIKTNQDEILKRIALAGYDSDKFLAPDDVYSKLAGCCQYERVKKTAIVSTAVIEDHSMHNQENVVETKQEVNQLKTIFESYFALKDALVKSDGKLVSTLAKDVLANINSVKMEKLSSEEHTVWMKVMSSLKSNTEKIVATTIIEKQRVVFMDLSANFYALLKVSKQDYSIYYQNCPMKTTQCTIKKTYEVNQLKKKVSFKNSDGKLVSTFVAVKMEKLSSEEHTVWMKVMSSLKSNTEKIVATTIIEKQRVVFMDLSANFYALLKVSKQDYSIYYQNCPMYNDGKGANWLSKENAVKNPYYGSQMLTCGKTVETIK